MLIRRMFAVLTALAVVSTACADAATDPSTSAPVATTTSTTSQAAGGDTTAVSSQSFVSGEVVQLDLPRSDALVTDADIAAVVAADTALGLDLLRVAIGSQNVMVSPYSVATALSMLYPGARGQTASEIARVLHLEVEDSTLHEVRNHIDSVLNAPPPPLGDDDARVPFAIRPANSAWGQGGYPFLDGYLEVLASHYGAGLHLLDFVGDPDGATETINRWVEEVTEDRIQDLIPSDAIDVLTRLILVNAIWFKANWATMFDPAATANGRFALLDGNEVSVPLMHSSIRTGFADNGLFEAVLLPYAGDAAMVVALPRSGSPSDLLEQLDAEDFQIEWGDFQVDLTLPRFEFEAELALKETLQSLGMLAAFVPPGSGSEREADLTGITAVRELYVSDAFHRTFIAVDENGTEAAAATALISGVTSLPMPATFAADRPFLFWIEHASTGEVLFLGQVTNPLEN